MAHVQAACTAQLHPATLPPQSQPRCGRPLPPTTQPTHPLQLGGGGHKGRPGGVCGQPAVRHRLALHQVLVVESIHSRPQALCNLREQGRMTVGTLVASARPQVLARQIGRASARVAAEGCTQPVAHLVSGACRPKPRHLPVERLAPAAGRRRVRGQAQQQLRAPLHQLRCERQLRIRAARWGRHCQQLCCLQLAQLCGSCIGSQALGLLQPLRGLLQGKGSGRAGGKRCPHLRRQLAQPSTLSVLNRRGVCRRRRRCLNHAAKISRQRRRAGICQQLLQAAAVQQREHLGGAAQQLAAHENLRHRALARGGLDGSEHLAGAGGGGAIGECRLDCCSCWPAGAAAQASTPPVPLRWCHQRGCTNTHLHLLRQFIVDKGDAGSLRSKHADKSVCQAVPSGRRRQMLAADAWPTAGRPHTPAHLQPRLCCFAVRAPHSRDHCHLGLRRRCSRGSRHGLQQRRRRGRTELAHRRSTDAGSMPTLPLSEAQEGGLNWLQQHAAQPRMMAGQRAAPGRRRRTRRTGLPAQPACAAARHGLGGALPHCSSCGWPLADVRRRPVRVSARPCKQTPCKPAPGMCPALRVSRKAANCHGSHAPQSSSRPPSTSEWRQKTRSCLCHQPQCCCSDLCVIAVPPPGSATPTPLTDHALGANPVSY